LLKEYRDRFRKFRAPPHRAPHIRRVLLLSDLHMDYPANQEWLRNLCASNNDNENDDVVGHNATDRQTMMIVAGDVSHDLDILRWTFRTLKSRYGEVAFTPGNHELWLDGASRHGHKVATRLDADDDDVVRCRSSGAGDGCGDSVEKLDKVLQLCADEGVRIGPVKVGGSRASSGFSRGEVPLWVVPLLSWHHPSFDTEPPIERWGGIPSARKVVADYRRTAWPSPLSSLDDSAANFIDGLNDVILDFPDIDDADDEGATLLTFSHFLPRVELLPEKRYLSLPTLPSCVGSAFLEERLRRSRRRSLSERADGSGGGAIRHLHAFGHSHLAWDLTLDGVRYVHVPLAYPREWEQRRRSLEIGSMRGEVGGERRPVCVWEQPVGGEKGIKNDESGGGSPPMTTAGFPSRWLGGWWSKYYTVVPRQPDRNNELAPWAARRFRRLPGGEIEDFDHAKVEEKYQLQCPPTSGWVAGTGCWYERRGDRK